MTASEELVYELRPPAGEPEGALVLLHGRGTDELDLLPLIDALDPDRRLVGVSPRGPLALPPGGAHWYVVPRVGYPDRRTFNATYAMLARLLDALPGELGIAQDRMLIGGFSQGTVMAYALSLGPGRPSPAGVLALSGFIPSVPGFELELEGRAGLPVAIVHGRVDPVIPVGFARDARRRLEAAGLDVLYHEPDIGHQVEPSLIPELRDWAWRALDREGTMAAETASG